MATNITADGSRLPVVAPAAVNAGSLVVVGNIFGVALTSAASAANVVIQTGPALARLRKLAGAAINQGANVHWDATNANCTVSATSNTKIGVAAITAASADTIVEVRLNGSF